jgi:PAS domain-containing protein
MSRILLLLGHRENRRLMRELLSQSYDVLESTTIDALDESFDLGVVDGMALDRYWENVQSRRQAEGATFLPFLLVSSRQDVGMVTRHLWRVIDELILTPIERVELLARVETLLRSRRYSLESESKYYTLAEHAPVGIFLARDGQILYANRALFGIVRRTWPWGGNSHEGDVATEEDEPSGRLTDWLARQPASVQPRLIHVPTPDGECWLEVISSKVRHQGEPSVMGIVTDVTERLHARELSDEDC